MYTDLEASAAVSHVLPVIQQRLRKDVCWVTRYAERFGPTWTEPSEEWWARIANFVANLLGSQPFFTEDHCHVYTEPAGKDLYVRLSYEDC